MLHQHHIKGAQVVHACITAHTPYFALIKQFTISHQQIHNPQSAHIDVETRYKHTQIHTYQHKKMHAHALSDGGPSISSGASGTQSGCKAHHRIHGHWEDSTPARQVSSQDGNRGLCLLPYMACRIGLCGGTQFQRRPILCSTTHTHTHVQYIAQPRSFRDVQYFARPTSHLSCTASHASIYNTLLTHAMPLAQHQRFFYLSHVQRLVGLCNP